MNERDIELVNKVVEMTPDVYNTTYASGMKCIEFTEDALQKFADLIRADEREACATHYLGIMRGAIAEEREACAKICEEAPEPDGSDLAKRIRARGNK